MAEQRRLLILRHAKSSWDDPGLDDHDRPLAPRGRRAAGLIGEHLRSEQITIDLVLCSSARRAQETLELVAPDGGIRIEPELYGASASELLDRLHQVDDAVESVMLIGHNPAMQELAAGLSEGAGELAESKFPTGALATLAFDGPWRGLRQRQARLVAFVKPRDLA